MSRGGSVRSRNVTTLVVVAVLALVVWGCDWGARLAGESIVAQAIRADTRLGASVDVAVDGWFFLPQVISGEYGHLVVTMSHATAQGLRIKRLRTDLYDVAAPFSDVIHQHVSRITVQRTHEQALLTYQALNAYLAAHGSRYTLSKGRGDEVAVTTRLSMFGQSVPVSADAKVIPGPGYLDIEPTGITTGSSIVDAIGDFALKARLRFRISMQPLPFGQQVRSVRAAQQGLDVDAAGAGVVITRQGISTADALSRK